MKKADFPPIFHPGLHLITLEKLKDATVNDFPLDRVRTRHFVLFRQWVSLLQELQVSATLWIDGSFVTRKPAPADIDCVMWNPGFNSFSGMRQRLRVSALLDRANAKAQYGIDFYLEVSTPEQLFHRESYWKGVFGFQHDRVTAKGFVEVLI